MQAVANKLLIPIKRQEKIQFFLRLALSIPLTYVFFVDMINTLCNQRVAFFDLKNQKPPNEGNPFLRLARNANSMIVIWLFMMCCYFYIIFRTSLTWKMTLPVLVLMLMGIYGHTYGACTWISLCMDYSFMKCSKLHCMKPNFLYGKIFYVIVIPILFGVVLFACFLFLLDVSTLIQSYVPRSHRILPMIM